MQERSPFPSRFLLVIVRLFFLLAVYRTVLACRLLKVAEPMVLNDVSTLVAIRTSRYKIVKIGMS